LSVEAIHGHVRALQGRFLGQLAEARILNLTPRQLVPGKDITERGNFLTFRTEEADEIFQRLEAENVMTDYRGDRLRFGFGIYQDESDVDELLVRLRRAMS
jgi:selenocysteine lyase/cysteine desulfurase